MRSAFELNCGVTGLLCTLKRTPFGSVIKESVLAGGDWKMVGLVFMAQA